MKAYVTGPAPTVADMNIAGQKTVMLVTVTSLAVIFITLLLVYRSVLTVILLLLMVGLQLQVARGVVAFLGHLQLVGLTTFAVNLLVAAVIATGTDYGIFFVGRYQEARQAGEDRETAFYTTFGGVAKVVLASGLTIAVPIRRQRCVVMIRLGSNMPKRPPTTSSAGASVSATRTAMVMPTAHGMPSGWK
ncbi:hypothetical protein A5674_17785 [Mycobacterium malmoense]|nr:hypothetical protein A5674_17785 [Mycobacterium malmoense]